MHIETVTLWTADLNAQHAFYAATLGLEAIARTPARATLRAGRTLLTFQQHADFEGFYHLAFDIPRNRVDEAEVWLRARVPLLEDAKGVSRFPLSEGWNSESLYFGDAAGNILEFIVRRDLPSDSAAPFSPASILHVSELGVIVPDVTAAVLDLERRFGLSPFNEQGSTFSPVGDQGGLLIVVREGRGWFPTGRPAIAAPFRMTFEHQGRVNRLRNGERLQFP
ncbi:VOC family protein [Deinococcus frigens]|uniref:VOC family protein n=1 Tax=Deinococcus frigens TaxID=249403 RepID=UPI0005541E92|nr:hypothetical protein [Deinococcus frigens]